MVTLLAPPRATLDDLMRTEGKAELIAGRIVKFMPTGRRPNRVAGFIYSSLRMYDSIHGGEAYSDGIGFNVPELLSGRETFSPDASYYTGPQLADDMKFVAGAPDFAVEVRSENDYGYSAEQEMAAKRADYFEAGTLVVWDVDPQAKTVRKYSANGSVREFGLGEVADAEPAAPGWSIQLDGLFKD
jgi:Uma2 family endonuclease